LKHRFRRFNSIPESKSSLWLLAAKFGPAMLSKSPIVLESEGMGSKKFHGRVVLLVDRHTASAAEMIVAFVRENKLGTIVGEPTAGRLLSATSVKVGEGYRLALPTGAYYTWNGSVLEGTPIEPDELVEFDWKERRAGTDAQLNRALGFLQSGSFAQAS
jgi:C-terminal processing protease CtpA/Prc